MAVSPGTFRSALYAAAAITAAAALSACASAPSSTAPAVHATATSRSAAAAPGEKTKSSPLISQVKLIHQAWQEGLPVRVGIMNGVTYYCWSDENVGSMIPSTKCLTESQLRQVVAQRRRAREEGQTAGGLPCNDKQLCSN